MSKTFPPVTSVKFRLSCFLALTLVAAPMASSPAFAADDDELIYDRDADPVVLSEMEVYGSQGSAAGYQSRQSLAATKTDTPLVDVPQSITVVTRELIDDQAMRSMGDVVRYMPGVGIAQGEGNRDTPVLRGNSSTASFFLDGIRDDVEYFRDFYNVDRVEALKGPNAMIFGRGGPGGLINRVTKQANQTPVRELAFTVGAWEQYRTTVDFGHPVSDRLSLRVNGLYEDSRSYRDGFTLRRYAANPTLACQIAPRTTLRAGFEYFHDERIADRGVPSYQGRPLAVAAETFFGDPAQSPTHTTVRAFNAALHHNFGHGLTLRNTTRFADYDKFYQNVFPGAVNAAGTTVAISAYNNDTDRENFFNQTDLVYTTGTGRIEHVILLGLELGRQETDNLRNTGYFTAVSPSTTSVSVPLTSPRYTHSVSFQPSATDASNPGVADTVAVYAHDPLTLLPQLPAVLGTRLANFPVDLRHHPTPPSPPPPLPSPPPPPAPGPPPPTGGCWAGGGGVAAACRPPRGTAPSISAITAPAPRSRNATAWSRRAPASSGNPRLRLPSTPATRNRACPALANNWPRSPSPIAPLIPKNSRISNSASNGTPGPNYRSPPPVTSSIAATSWSPTPPMSRVPFWSTARARRVSS